MLGSLIRPLRQATNDHLNREVRWDLHGDVPSGWASEKPEPTRFAKIEHRFYDRLRRYSDTGKHGGDEWGRRDEVSRTKEPDVEQQLPGGVDTMERDVERRLPGDYEES
jgi:hydrogenase small subunit